LSEKQHIILKVDTNKLLTFAEMAKCLGLALPFLSKIMLLRDKMLGAERKYRNQCKERKNLQIGANEELEKILVEWFQQMRADYISIDGPELDVSL
jgi:hypothetical protein